MFKELFTEASNGDVFRILLDGDVWVDDITPKELESYKASAAKKYSKEKMTVQTYFKKDNHSDRKYKDV